MKRLVYLITVALVALLILVPTATAQQMEMTMQKEIESTGPLPKSGGVQFGSPSLLLPAAALLLGGAVLGYAVLRRR